jgi:endoglucanase
MLLLALAQPLLGGQATSSRANATSPRAAPRPRTSEVAPGVFDFGYVERDPTYAPCARDPARLPRPASIDDRPSNYLHTCGNRIYDSNGSPFTFYGVNWFGLETRDFAPRGLRERNWGDLLDQVAALGYNTIRLPFSSDSINSGASHPPKTIDYALNPDLAGLSDLELLDRLVAGARERGLRVVIDRHRVHASVETPFWYAGQEGDEKWVADWRMLAARYAGNDTVVAVDLHNEPHGAADWGNGNPATDWRLASERAGDAVLQANPYLLVFVEGIETYRNDSYWWGGQLMGARDAPVRLRVPDRLVYSPHDYGPSVYEQTYFSDKNYPANLAAIWDRHWGFIHDDGIAPLVIGEFGGKSVGTDHDGLWQRAFLDYIGRRGIGFIIWSLNPNDETGGILEDDWRTINQDKYRAYARAAAGAGPTVETASTAGAVGQPSDYRIEVRPVVAADPTPAIAFEFRLASHSTEPLDLSRCEIRYWFAAGGLDPAVTEQLAFAAPSSSGAPDLDIAVVADDRGGQSHYLRLRPAGGLVQPFDRGPVWRVDLLRSDFSSYVQANDFSFAGASLSTNRFTEWDRVALYVDGRLVWGREPER